MARVIKARNITYHRPQYPAQFQNFDRRPTPAQQAMRPPQKPMEVERITKPPVPQVTESEAILQKAREEAEAIKKNAYIQGEKLGYEAGLTKGMEEGLKEGRQSIDEEQHRMLRSCKHLYESILRKRQQLVDEASEEMLELSYEIAEKILCIEIERNDKLIIEVFRQAVGALMSKQKISVRLNPVDAEQLQNAKEPLVDELGIEGLSIIADEKLDRMSCVVKTPNETVDASINTQLEEIKTQHEYMNGESYE